MRNDQKANEWFRQGNSLYEAKRYEEALRSYDQAVKIDPGNIRAWDNRGLCLANLNRHAEAIPCYDKALQIDPKNVAAWCNRGISLSALSRNEEALQCFDKALNLDANHSIIWQKKGDSLRNLGRRKEAIGCYDVAVKLDERNALGWYYKALCEDELGQAQKASFSYSTVITLSMGVEPEFTMDNGKPTLKARSIQPVLIEHELYAHALERFNELGKPSNPVVDSEKNSAANGNATSALPPCKQTVTPSPQRGIVSTSAIAQSEQLQDWELEGIDANNWFSKGESLFVLGKFEEALGCFDQALALEPQYEDAWLEKAGCEEKLGRTLDAIHSYNKVLDFVDDDAHEQIKSVVTHLAELEKEATRSSNRQEALAHDDPQVEQTAANLAKDYIYHLGDMIGQKYEVQGMPSYGGCGVVYPVYSLETREVYALKTFKDEYLVDAQARERFRKEAYVWVELERHPYLVRAYLVDEISGRLYIAMDYIAPNEQGINTLEGFLERHPPTLKQSLRWAIQICYGMEYAYSKGVRAHRDLKPANIMISQDGRAMITDFGLAGILDTFQIGTASPIAICPDNDARSGKTQMGIGFGTPQYMPPEQFENAAGCDQRSDIYAMGIILFQMASGDKMPFDSPEGNWQVWYELHSQAPIPYLDSPLFPVIQRCLQKELGMRYQHFEQLRSDLEALLNHESGEVMYAPKLGNLDAAEWNMKGMSLTRLGRNEEAIRCFDQALKSDPQDEMVWNNKGTGLSDLSRSEEAIFCYENAIRINPKYGHAWSGKGKCLAALHRLKEASQCFEHALDCDPEDEKSWSNQGTCLTEQGRHEEATHCFDQALKLFPLDNIALSNKGYNFFRLKRYREALQCYDEAIHINPQDVLVWFRKGLSLLSLGRHEEAVSCYDKALELNPNLVEAWDQKGFSLESLGRYEEALRCYDKAMEIDPNHVEAWVSKGFRFENLGHLKEALHCYDKALEIDPKNIRAWANKGNILNTLNRDEEAVRCCDKALELNPNDAGAWYPLYNKATSEDKIGRKSEALRSYKQFLNLAPAEFAEAIQIARQRIRELGGY